MFSNGKHFSLKVFQKMVKQLKLGDNKLFDSYFDYLGKEVIFHLNSKYRASRFDAQEATVKAMYIIYNKLVEDKVKFETLNNYFSRIAYHEFLKIQNKKRNNTLLVESEIIPEINYSEEKEEDTIFTEINFNLLKKSIRKMDSGCKEIFKLVFNKGMKQNDVADKLNISYSSLRKKKQRCIEKLKEMLLPLIEKAKFQKVY